MSDIDAVRLRRLDMTLLLVFAELMRRRKLTLVAERLGLTQSAVSHALKRLRDIMEDELFLRRPNGVEPTARAEALEPKVTAILELAQAALRLEAAFDPATAERTLMVGASDLETALLAPALAALTRDTAPGIRVGFRPLVRKAALAALDADEVQLAVGFFPEIPAGFLAEPLQEERFAVAAAPDHPAARAGMTLDAYCLAEHALTSVAGDWQGAADAALAGLGRTRRVRVVVPSFFPALAAAARSGLVLTAPRRFLEAYAASFGLVLFPAPLPIAPFTLTAVRHRRSAADPAVSWLLDRVREG